MRCLRSWRSRRGTQPRRENDRVVDRVQQAGAVLAFAVGIPVAGRERLLLGRALRRRAGHNEKAAPGVEGRRLGPGRCTIARHIGALPQALRRCRYLVGIEKAGIGNARHRSARWARLSGVAVNSIVHRQQNAGVPEPHLAGFEHAFLGNERVAPPARSPGAGWRVNRQRLVHIRFQILAHLRFPMGIAGRQSRNRSQQGIADDGLLRRS